MATPIIVEGLTVFFDVDDTLVMWGLDDHPEAFELDSNGVMVKLVPHQLHITKMREHRARGHKIIVWSAGGYAWAHEVCEALMITHLADVIMAKPSWFYDDVRSEMFMPDCNRIYYEDFKKRDKGWS